MALLKYFHLLGFEVVQYREYFDAHLHVSNPFNSNRKRMSKVVSVGERNFVFMKGASEYMLEACDKIIDLKSNTVSKIDPATEKEAIGAINKMATQALRTIGLCYKEIPEKHVN